jgi:hypothetical protein
MQASPFDGPGGNGAAKLELAYAIMQAARTWKRMVRGVFEVWWSE